MHSSYNGGDPTGRQTALFLMNGPNYPANLQYQGNELSRLDVLRAFSDQASSITTSGYDQRVDSGSENFVGVIAERAHWSGPSIVLRALNLGQLQAVARTGPARERSTPRQPMPKASG